MVQQEEAVEKTLAYYLLKQEIEDFLIEEADLLDDRRYEEWLNLLTDDIRYWVPLRRNVKFGEWDRELTRERQDLSWFDEGKETLTMRVKQILTGVNWAEEPSSRITHFVSGIRLVKISPLVEAPEEVTVGSRLLVYQNRVATETNILVGRREDILRKVDGQWKIARRKFLLDQSVLLAKSMTFFF